MWCFTYILYLNFIASIIICHSGLNFSYLHFIISTVVYIYDRSNLCLKHNPIVKHQSPDSYWLCFSSSFVGVSCEALSSLCIMIHHFYIFWNHSPLKILDWYMVAHNSYVLNTHLFLSCCLFSVYSIVMCCFEINLLALLMFSLTLLSVPVPLTIRSPHQWCNC